MKNIDRSLIGGRALVLFDVAARHDSFSRAAEQLGLGQPAVSHAVRQLEQSLGVALFERSATGVTLTAAGRLLADRVGQGLEIIHEGLESVRQDPGGDSRITLSVSTSFASFWLMPRIARLKTRFPDIEIRCITNDDDRDLGSPHYDLSIPLGGGPWQGFRRWHFAEEEIYPVCRADYLPTGRDAEIAELLPDLPLLHLEESYRPRMDWDGWFAATGLTVRGLRGGYSSNDYSIILQAALDGQGVALGWHHIVGDLVARGDLVKVGSRTVRTKQPFYILSPEAAPPAPGARAIRDWLISESPTSQNR